jgi:thiol-disulfide isomerase/thioredoxin
LFVITYDYLVGECRISKLVFCFCFSWCTPCHKIQPYYQRISSLYAESASFLTIDVDDFDGIAGKYNVAMMPTFLVVQGDRVLGTYRGSSEPELESFLRSQLAP